MVLRSAMLDANGFQALPRSLKKHAAIRQKQVCTQISWLGGRRRILGCIVRSRANRVIICRFKWDPCPKTILIANGPTLYPGHEVMVGRPKILVIFAQELALCTQDMWVGARLRWWRCRCATGSSNFVRILSITVIGGG